MRILRLIKTVATGVGFVVTALVLSYCSDFPKYNFQREAAAFGRTVRGARLVDRSFEVDPFSFVTWIGPPATSWNYAFPDPLVADRFFMVNLSYDENKPLYSLIDVDCKAHEEEARYDLDESETAVAARDVWGDPVTDANGNIYRETKDWRKHPIPQKWTHEFCDTDWEMERKEFARAILARELHLKDHWMQIW